MFTPAKRSSGLHKKSGSNPLPKHASAGFSLIQSGEALLANNKAQDFLQRIQKLQHLSSEQWHMNYKPLFIHYAEYVQQLPAHAHLTRTGDENLLLRGLYLAHLALSCPQHMSELWRFALTSALLLRDMIGLITEFDVTLFDHAQRPLQRWLPFEGAMVGKGVYYQFGIADALQARTAKQQVAPLVARVVLPESSFNWLASDPNVFSAWMNWLAGDRERGGVLPTVWPWIDERLEMQNIGEKQMLKEELQQSDRKQEQKKGLIKNGLFGLSDSDFSFSDELGAVFVAWLIKQLKSKKMSVNQKSSAVHRLQNGGIFLNSQAIYQEFFKAHQQYQGQQIQIEKYLVDKGLLQKNDQGGIMHHVSTKHHLPQTKTMSGVVLNNPALLFSTSMPAVNYDLRLTSALFAKFAIQNNATGGLTQAPAFEKNSDTPMINKK